MTDEHGAPPTGGRAGRGRIVLACSLGAAAIAVGARVTVPMGPVPMTLQTLAVLTAGALGGWRVGAGAALVYLALVVAGAPILADGARAAGPEFLELKSAGYVVGFVPAGALAGLSPGALKGLSPGALKDLSSGALRGLSPGALRGLSPGPGEGRRGLAGALVRLSWMLVAHAVILALGSAWLARSIGATAAWEHGVRPFLAGAALKSLVAASIASRARRSALHW